MLTSVPAAPEATREHNVRETRSSLTACQILGGAVLPTLADVLALETVRRGWPEVLTGPDRLAVPVRWVHAIEQADAARLLHGGELVLSTGIALPDETEPLADYDAGLAAAGVSGLAVELGRRYAR